MCNAGKNQHSRERRTPNSKGRAMAYDRKKILEHCSDSFIAASSILKDKFERNPDCLAIALVVNAAFAAELTMKRYIEISTGMPVRGHKLQELWNQIGNRSVGKKTRSCGEWGLLACRHGRAELRRMPGAFEAACGSRGAAARTRSAFEAECVEFLDPALGQSATSTGAGAQEADRACWRLSCAVDLHSPRWRGADEQPYRALSAFGSALASNAFGCHSEAGCRFVERILTVVQTLRLQKRPVLEFLCQSVLAHRHAQKAPALVAAA
jgi:hypothetical protein